MAERKCEHRFDTSWAWAVDCGTLIATFILISWIRIQGLIFVEIQSLTGAKTADVAWVGAGAVVVWHFVAPFGAILAVRFGTRKVVAVGASILCASQCSGFFIRELPGFIAMGIASGLGSSLCYTPSIVILSHYFRRRLGLATAITGCGSSLSQFVMAPLSAYLLESHGLPGTLLIIGGISLHLFVSVALFCPISESRLRQAEMDYDAAVMKAKLKPGDEVEEGEVVPPGDEVEVNELRQVKMKLTQDSSMTNSGDRLKHEDNQSLPEIYINASMTSLPASTKGGVEKTSSTRQSVRRLMTNALFWLLVLGFSVGAMAANSVIRYGPAYVVEHDLTLTDVSLFLALSGFPSVIVRLLVGIIADLDFVKRRLQRYRLFVFGILMTVLIDVILVLDTSYWGFLFNFLLMGTSGGFFHTLSSVTAFDLLGREEYAVGYGMMSFAAGLLAIVDSTVIARLRDVTGSFHASFLVCGGLGLIVSIILLTVIPIVQWRRARGTS